MPRLAANALLVASTLFAVLAVVVWGRSYVACDSISFRWDDRPGDFKAVSTVTGGGCVLLSKHHAATSSTADWSRGITLNFGPKVAGLANRTGFDGFSARRMSYGMSLRVPLGWPTAVLLLPLGVRVRRVRRAQETARRRAAGECLACGYDLRASGDRCPECGAVITPG